MCEMSLDMQIKTDTVFEHARSDSVPMGVTKRSVKIIDIAYSVDTRAVLL